MGEDKQEPTTEGESGWQYKPAEGEAPTVATMDEPTSAAPSGATSVEWTASEFVAHEKGVGWYMILAVLALIVGAGLYFTTRDIFSVVVVLIMAITFGVASGHKPRVIEYTLDDRGLTAGKKFYPYSDYKSFSMPEDGPFTSIALSPMKRLSFPVGAYLAPDTQKEALDLISNHLPLERGELDKVDHLMRKLRF